MDSPALGSSSVNATVEPRKRSTGSEDFTGLKRPGSCHRFDASNWGDMTLHNFHLGSR